MPNSKLQTHQEGPTVQYQAQWVSTAFIIIFLSPPSYVFLNYNTRYVINSVPETPKRTSVLSGADTAGNIPRHCSFSSLTEPPFPSGDQTYSTWVETKIGLSHYGIHYSSLPVTDVAVAMRLSSGK